MTNMYQQKKTKKSDGSMYQQKKTKKSDGSMYQQTRTAKPLEQKMTVSQGAKFHNIKIDGKNIAIPTATFAEDMVSDIKKLKAENDDLRNYIRRLEMNIQAIQQTMQSKNGH